MHTLSNVISLLLDVTKCNELRISQYQKYYWIITDADLILME